MNSIWYDLNQIHRPSYSFTSVHICAHLTPSHHSNWLTYEKRSAYFHAIKKMERTTTEINSCLCLSASLFLKSKNVSIIRNGAISMKKLTHRPAKKKTNYHRNDQNVVSLNLFAGCKIACYAKIQHE